MAVKTGLVRVRVVQAEVVATEILVDVVRAEQEKELVVEKAEARIEKDRSILWRIVH